MITVASWDSLRQTISSVRFFGRTDVADLLDEARFIVEAPGSKAAHWGGYIEDVDPTGRLDSLGQKLQGRYGDLWTDIDEAASRVGH